MVCSVAGKAVPGDNSDVAAKAEDVTAEAEDSEDVFGRRS